MDFGGPRIKWVIALPRSVAALGFFCNFFFLKQVNLTQAALQILTDLFCCPKVRLFDALGRVGAEVRTNRIHEPYLRFCADWDSL